MSSETSDSNTSKQSELDSQTGTPWVFFASFLAPAPHYVLPSEPREPYGIPLLDLPTFDGNDHLNFWDRYCALHDFTTILMGELATLSYLARSAQEGGRLPKTAGDSVADLPFSHAIVLHVHQFLLAVWELDLNNWRPLSGSDLVHLSLFNACKRGPVSIGGIESNSVFDVIFRCVFEIKEICENFPGLTHTLGSLRHTHRTHHRTNRWCWLKYSYVTRQICDIHRLMMFHLDRLGPDDSKERRDCVRWRDAAAVQLHNLTHCKFGFDWPLIKPEEVDVSALVDHLMILLDEFDSSRLATELIAENNEVREWFGRDGKTRPRWFADNRELWFGFKKVRSVRSIAKNVITILNVFEEENWPTRIDDPLPPSDARKISETVRTLNERCKGIRFEADGTGEGIRWRKDADGD